MLRRQTPVLLVTAALACAAVLIVYLEHRARGALEKQTAVILETISAQAADAAVLQIRRVFEEGPIFDTLNAVPLQVIDAGRIDLLAGEYASGLKKYPQVERFFIWSSATEVSTPREVLFFGRSPGPCRDGLKTTLEYGFCRDPILGKAIYQVAEQHRGSRTTFVAAERRINGTTYDVFMRSMRVDVKTDRLRMLLGFVVNFDSVRTAVFPELYQTSLANTLNVNRPSPELELRILDEAGHVVFGPAGPIPPVAARKTLPLAFYSAELLESRTAGGIEPKAWTLVVAPHELDAQMVLAIASIPSYWLSSISVCLILAALLLIVRGQRRATQLANMQTEFIHHVSHQLKTPLSVLGAVSETVVLNRVRTREKLAQYLGIIRDETLRLSALVDRILEFSRTGSGHYRYEFELTPIGPLVCETVEAFRCKLPGDFSGIAVEQREQDLNVMADPVALEQVLVNLLDNAVKYSRETKEIIVRIRQVGSEVTIEVVDRGIGIQKSDLEKIFEKFYRARSVAHSHPGFGLGLAIAKQVVRAHHGRLEVESQPGSGSTFRVCLRLVHQRVMKEAAEARASQAPQLHEVGAKSA